MPMLKIPKLWPAVQLVRASSPSADVVTVPAVSPSEGLDAFGSETERADEPGPVMLAPAPAPASVKRLSATRVPAAATWLAVVLLSAAVGVAAVLGYQRRFVRAATTGSVTLDTLPQGLDVTLAGKSLGKTPFSTSLAPGAYDVQVGSGPNARTIRLNVAAGASLVHQIEFAAAPQPAGIATGGLRVQTDPVHLPVVIDGVAQGAAPVNIESIKSGEHEVLVRTSTGVVRRAVSVQAGEMLSLVVSAAAPPPVSPAVSAGWLTVTSPLVLQLREGGKLIGTSESGRLMLPSGDHDIEFENAPLGFTVRRTVRVATGKTSVTKIDVPNGVLSINAQPWAEVWLDGERIGETPIGNLSRQIGTHEVVFRHPEFGEHRETVVIAVGKPARIGVDLRKK